MAHSFILRVQYETAEHGARESLAHLEIRRLLGTFDSGFLFSPKRFIESVTLSGLRTFSTRNVSLIRLKIEIRSKNLNYKERSLRFFYAELDTLPRGMLSVYCRRESQNQHQRGCM